MPNGYLLKNGDVYCPEHIGRKDILVLGDKIVLVDDGIDVRFQI